MGLLEKSSNNRICTDWACEKEYYDVAVSRLYYSLYQKFIQIDFNLELKVEITYGNMSHDNYIRNFVKVLNDKNKVDADEKKTILTMHHLRKKRKKADYDIDMIDKSEFEDIVVRADKIDKVLNKLVES